MPDSLEAGFFIVHLARCELVIPLAFLNRLSF